MALPSKLKKIDNLQQKIQLHGKLNKEVLQKINYKFRLEWNYYSNRMEGNTLTLDETKSVMIGNVDVHDKPLKDVFEMKGHDEAVVSIIKMGKGELNISETRIKGLHKTIMYEDSSLEKNKIGKWKDVPNHIFNHKNEKFDFVSPADVPEAMHELINWINTEKEKIQRDDKKVLHPVVLAFQFHLKYLTIHPFYDGNGRTGRILTNLILISYGYPPIYINDKEKKSYYQYLAEVQGYGADSNLLYDLMANFLIRSLNLVLDVIEGRDIDDPEDLDKKIFMLEKELEINDPDSEIKQHFSKEVFFEIVDSWLGDLLSTTIPVVQKFNKFFTGTRHYIGTRNGMGSVNFVNEPPSEITEKFIESCQKNSNHFSEHDMEVTFQTSYGTLKKGGLKTFGCNYSFRVKFDQISYEVFVDEFSEEGKKKEVRLYQRLLHKPLTSTEIKKVANKLGDTIYQHIDFNTKENGLR